MRSAESDALQLQRKRDVREHGSPGKEIGVLEDEGGARCSIVASVELDLSRRSVDRGRR
jgi:hypothetical protein